LRRLSVPLTSLLTYQFAPTTFQIGFLETRLSKAAETYEHWHGRLANEYRTQFSKRATTGGLRDCLRQLEPLTTPQDHDLIIETESPWVAFFTNGSRVPDVVSPVGELCRLIECRGLAVRCIPDRHSGNSKQPCTFGCVSFDLFSPHKTEWLNVERSVCSMNDGGRWKFWARGTPQIYEEIDRYRERRIIDRFTPDMLSRYCKALGLRAFEWDFYGGNGIIGIHPIAELADGSKPERLSMSEARDRLFL
jgi:hypothetical protein